MTTQDIKYGKTWAVVSYLTIIGSVIAIIMNSEDHNKFTSFHNRQGLGICLTYLFFGYVQGLYDNWLITLPFMICFGLLLVFGVITAATGKAILIPFIGPLYQKLFANIIK